MVQLKYLDIEDCKVMEEVLFIEDLGEEEIIPKVLFPRLEHLVLKDLPVLKRFCVGSNIKFPSLQVMVIEQCTKLESFIFKPVSSGMTVSKELKKVNSEEISHTAMQPLFNEEVAFPSLETLKVMHMENLKIIWHDQFAENSFFKLQSLFVQYCENLVNIFESNMLTRFQSLETLEVSYCGSLQEVFELQRHDVRESHIVTAIPLKTLILKSLPKMKHVWNEDPQGIFSFQNLQVIRVCECESLNSLFPASLARFLMQLEDLRIVDCGVEEIVSREEIAEAAARFVFPKVTILVLRKLPKLKWFCRGVYTSEWPLLKDLEVSECDQIEIFASKILNFQETVERSQLETSIQLHLFLVEEVAFPSLETLRLDQCVLEDKAMIGELRNLKILSLVHSNVEQLPTETGFLTRLRILNLSNCTKLKVIPPNVLSCLIQLEELYVGNSFTQWDVEELNNERASLAELKHLSRLTTLEVHIPDANMLPKDLLFEKLQRYKIFVGDVWDWTDKHENSRALKLKLSTSFHLERGIKMLLNGIENLWLDELKGVKSVIYELDMTGFQQLKHLHVQNNVEIKYIINSTGMVISDVVFPVLEKLSLKNMINLEEICHGQIPLASFRNLSIMKVKHCEKLKFIFPSTIAKGLPQLLKLVIQECSIMGAIIIKEEGEIEDRDMILFPQLRHLELHQLPKLVSFLNTQKSVINDAGEIIPECELDFHMPILQEQVVFPKLESLKLSSIHSEEIPHNQHHASSAFKLANIQTDSRFQNLCYLTVKGSGNLKYLLSSSTARFMVQLKYLYIEDCKEMEEILLTEDSGEEEIIPKVLFPQLKDLFLKDLPVLKRFCMGSNIRFPSLTGMTIEQCPKLESFIFKPVSSEEMNSEEISRTTMQPLFNEKVAFPSLETLKIKHMENLKIIWHDQLVENSFFKLQSLLVEYCENLVNIIESNMLTRFQSLETLQVYNCGSLQEVFEIQGHDYRDTHAVTVIPLKRFYLRHLPKMKQIWNKDPHGIFNFPNLQVVSAWECESLQSLFPASVARCLMQLEDLRIADCGVEEIVSQEEIAEAAARFVFPKVTLLILHKLPKLKWFYRGVHTSEWPLLKKLDVYGCDQIEIFTSKKFRNEEPDEQSLSETSIQQRLFLVEEVAFPNLETLIISYMPNLKIIWHDKFAPGSFTKLQSMKVQFCENLMKIFQVNMLSRFQSLESLVVADCGSVQEIFELQGQEVTETRAIIVTQLKKLFMHRLPKLKCVWNKDPKGTFSFPNLQKISVWECESLKSLFPTSLARCLKQLEDLQIAECGIEEIIEQEEGAKEDARFMFPKLTLLMLRQLPKLKWFYRGVHTSEWPLLKTLEVSGSNEIQIFASKEFRIEEPDEQSQLETSIQQPLFLVEEVAFPSLETLTVMHMENLKIIWHDQLAEDSFFKLQSLSVEYCENLVNIFESNMLTRFQSLERLEVSYCGSLQEVFELQRHDVIESHAVTAIPLKRLMLHSLPKMKRVWNKDPQGIFSFQNLQEISVLECESLQSLFPASVARFLMQLEDLQIDDCGVEEIVSREEIAKAATRFVFPKVTLLVLSKLPELKWFCRGVHTSEWPLLKELEVSECDQIEIFASKILNFQETDEESQLETSIQQPLFLVEEVRG
ncbi:uncharacterized protein LOC115979758 [Quercus lobata]|uniref:uncharacterized protein LOC115979758 n=1 Tax=Quercus lobata TaxID=97700 RepID=UPI001246D135|nr:uncharacterized protein LOC115979758 [Quercus lobata]